MGRLFSNPKVLALVVAVLAAVLISIAGGALGAAFGFGFLGGPVPFISLPAERVATIAGFQLLNTTVMLWLAIVVLVFLSWLATRRMTDVPSGWQNVFEAIIQFFIDTAEGVGGKAARAFLPVVITIFLGVLFFNWLGILPIVGSIGRVESIEEWVHHHAEEEIEALHDAQPELGDEEVEVIGTLETLLHSAEETFVVFDGESLALIPFGRGEAQRAPLHAIVPFNQQIVEGIIEALERGETVGSLDAELAAEWHRIEDDIHAGAVRLRFADADGDTYNFQGKTAGILVPFFRGASTDLNTTLAVAIFAMISVQFFGFRALGLRGYGGKFIQNPLKHGLIGTFVGILELFGEFTKVISFTFRLFGNMFAGEVLLVAMGFLLPLIGIIPFLGIELFVGLIQAFIFAMLTLVFAATAVESHDDHEEGHGGHDLEEGQAAH